jgi:diguanylate cyclase (GGDEF)-like protein
VGDPLQEVLPGRGDEEREGRGVGRTKTKALASLGARLLILFVLFAELFFSFPARFHPVWFFAPAGAVCLFFLLESMRTGASLEKALFFSSLSVAVGGGSVIHPFIRLLFVPLATFTAAFFPPAAFVPAWVSAALAEARGLAGLEAAVVSTLGAAFGSGLAAYLSARRLRAENIRLRQEAHVLKESPSFIAGDAGLRDASEKEMAGVLELARESLGADAASLFLAERGNLVLGASTAGDIRLSGEGYLWLSFRKRQPVAAGNLGGGGGKPGYEREARIGSFMAAPVADGNFVLGVLAADSLRPDAFDGRERSALDVFAALVAGMLRRQRVSREVNRRLDGFEVIKDTSQRLLHSLEVEALSREAAIGASRIAAAGAALFVRQEAGYKLAGLAGLGEPAARDFRDFRGSLIENVLRSGEPAYLSDLGSYRLPAVPFDAGPMRAAYIQPLAYEGETLGVLVLFSRERDPLTAYQIELVKLFANQLAVALSRALLHERLRLLATTDGLTGLFNHRHFQERLAEEFKRLGRYPRPLSLLLADIDYFKKVNDAYGHPAGDAVLRKTAAILRRIVRETDIPARYGGEEFAALLIDTDKAGALRVAERLRKAVAESAFEVDHQRALKVTVSIGVASCPDGASGRKELVELADKALYRAKHGGRNRVEQA